MGQNNIITRGLGGELQRLCCRGLGGTTTPGSSSGVFPYIPFHREGLRELIDVCGVNVQKFQDVAQVEGASVFFKQTEIMLTGIGVKSFEVSHLVQMTMLERLKEQAIAQGIKVFKVADELIVEADKGFVFRQLMNMQGVNVQKIEDKIALAGVSSFKIEEEVYMSGVKITHIKAGHTLEGKKDITPILIALDLI